MVHLNIHPTHGGKHVAIGAMRLVGLDLKDPPEQILVGLDPQEGLIDYTMWRRAATHDLSKLLEPNLSVLFCFLVYNRWRWKAKTKGKG